MSKLTLLVLLALSACERNPSAPVITGADPQFGLLTMSADQTMELTVRVLDTSERDGVLYARLFQGDAADAAARRYTQQETMLSAVSGSAQLTGSFFAPSGAQLCQLFPGGATLYVVVADRPFSDARGAEDTAPGGLTTENHWELSCR